MMHFVLYKEVDEREDGRVERAREVFAVSSGCWVLGTQCDHAERPRDSRDQV